MLRQLDHIAVEVSVACATTPGLSPGPVNHLSAPARTAAACDAIDVANGQGTICAPEVGFSFAISQGKIKVGLRLRQAISACLPPVHRSSTPIVTRMEIEAECISVQGFRTLQVRDLK